jgi:hypothetical protein
MVKKKMILAKKLVITTHPNHYMIYEPWSKIRPIVQNPLTCNHALQTLKKKKKHIDKNGLCLSFTIHLEGIDQTFVYVL